MDNNSKPKAKPKNENINVLMCLIHKDYSRLRGVVLSQEDANLILNALFEGFMKGENDLEAEMLEFLIPYVICNFKKKKLTNEVKICLTYSFLKGKKLT